MPSMLSTGTAGTWLEMCEEASVNSSDSSAHPLDLWSAVTYYIFVTISSISILSLYTCIYIIYNYIYIYIYRSLFCDLERPVECTRSPVGFHMISLGFAS